MRGAPVEGAALEGSGGGDKRCDAAGGSGGGTGRAGASPSRAIASAARMSPAVAKRRARSFSSARFTTATTPPGRSGTQRRAGGGWRCTTWNSTLGVVSASNGLWPVSSS